MFFLYFYLFFRFTFYNFLFFIFQTILYIRLSRSTFTKKLNVNIFLIQILMKYINFMQFGNILFISFLNLRKKRNIIIFGLSCFWQCLFNDWIIIFITLFIIIIIQLHLFWLISNKLPLCSIYYLCFILCLQIKTFFFFLILILTVQYYLIDWFVVLAVVMNLFLFEELTKGDLFLLFLYYFLLILRLIHILNFEKIIE
jgi:hypothetical protein